MVPISPVVSVARDAVFRGFSWQDGHADVWKLFSDAQALSAIVNGLVEPWRRGHVTHVVGIESRGFLLGGAVAISLSAGFHAIRKSDGLLPGPKLVVQTFEDYRSRRHELRMQATLGPDDSVLLVDDWAERGSQALAARELVERTGACFLGVSLIVDQLSDPVRDRLGLVTSLIDAHELGDSGELRLPEQDGSSGV